MLDPATFRSRASFFVFRVVPSSSFSARSRLLFPARFFFLPFFHFPSLSSLSVSPSGYRRPGSPSFAVLISSTSLRPGGYLRKARILPSHGHHCSDESRHCASKSKGVGVRFPCIPLHDRVSSSHPETKTRSIRFVYARKTANENKARGEKAKRRTSKRICVGRGRSRGKIVASLVRRFRNRLARLTVSRVTIPIASNLSLPSSASSVVIVVYR